MNQHRSAHWVSALLGLDEWAHALQHALTARLPDGHPADRGDERPAAGRSYVLVPLQVVEGAPARAGPGART